MNEKPRKRSEMGAINQEERRGQYTMWWQNMLKDREKIQRANEESECRMYDP